MEKEYPDKYVCPITLNLMLEPVKASDDNIYEKNAIEDWLSKNNTSPLTTQKISKNLIEMEQLKKEINKYIIENNLEIEEYKKFFKEKINTNYVLATYVEGSSTLFYFDCFVCNEPLIVPNYSSGIICQCGECYLPKECLSCSNKFIIKSEFSRYFKCDNCKESNRICDQCIIC